MAYKLLLADDSITIQKVVELTLSEEGFDVTAVGDGTAALDAAGKLMPDIVLADVFMPGLDGYELCEKLKSDGRFAGMPVMLLTGTFEEYDEARAARAGADDRLTKPFESAELVSKVKNLVENRAAAPAGEAEAVGVEEAAASVEAGTADDLWSVVDMGSEEQPLSSATEVISEEDLWKRANLVAEEPAGDEAMSVEELPIEAAEELEEAPEEIPSSFLEEAVEDESEVEAYEKSGMDRTAILNMDEIQSSIYGEHAEDVPAIEVSEAGPEPEITTFGTLGEATEAAGFAPIRPEPSFRTPEPAHAPSADDIRAEVMAAAQSIIDAKIKEALSAISSEMIERIVWEVVPELAEEIIQREVERIKAGS